jgi:hypothetical protein
MGCPFTSDLATIYFLGSSMFEEEGYNIIMTFVHGVTKWRISALRF